MKAIVLAAGEGQRLMPFTATKPKVMIEVGNKPVLQYVIEALKGAGIRKIVLVVGYRKERIIDYFGDGKEYGVEIEYVVQHQQLGTAHALKQAEKLSGDRFLVVPGDNIIDATTVECALEGNHVIVYKKFNEVSKYGVLIKEKGNVKSIIEKPEEEVSYLVNTGIYLLDASVYDYIKEEADLTSVINRMIEDNFEFEAVETEGLWLDIVYPWDILRVNDLALKHRGKRVSGIVEKNVSIAGDVLIGKGTVVKSGSYISGPVVIGENCEIGPDVVIDGPVSIGHGTKIGAFSTISNSVVGNHVNVGSGSHVECSVIDGNVNISPGFISICDLTEINLGNEVHRVETGGFIGENCRIGAKVVCMPGTMVGNGSEIFPLKVLKGIIPEGSRVL